MLKNKTKDTDFLFLTSMLRARESKLLTNEKLERLVDISEFEDAVKVLSDYGYPDMSGMSITTVDESLCDYRAQLFCELYGFREAVIFLDLFRLKYDYHNIKVLVKAAGANTTGDHLLSAAGRIAPKPLAEAFITGERRDLPIMMTEAMGKAFGTLSRTFDPQLADMVVDRQYFAELTELAQKIDLKFVTGYIHILIDSANLRTVVRSLRSKISTDFIKDALIAGGSIRTELLLKISPSGEELKDIFTASLLSNTAQLAPAAIAGGALTTFERSCDDAVTLYLRQAKLVSFGPQPVVAFIAAVEAELMSIRMILTGILSGIAPEIIRERLRNSYV